jgi:hypothetical protein
MARLIGGLGISHTPSMGGEYDRVGREQGAPLPNWQPWFDGTAEVRDVLATLAPDHLVVVYNDHLNHFDLDTLPALAIGIADGFPQADEGWGPRDLPDLAGETAWGTHLLRTLVDREFDPTMCLSLAPDHGIYSWFPYVFDQPWPVAITPVAVNMVCQPVPKASRMVALGRAIAAAVESYPSDQRVLVVGTGGMSHQISGARFGIANSEFNLAFLDALPDHLDVLLATPVEEMMRVGGTEAGELVLWYAMRAALPERVTTLAKFHTFPAITGCGALVLGVGGGAA